MLRKEFGQFKNFVFDIDGTIWYWDELIEGAKEAIEALRAEGKEVFFVTNNSMLSPEGFVKKLKSLGIETDKFHVTCSNEMIVTYLKENGVKRIFCLALEEAKKYFKESGFEFSESAPECVVIIYNEESEEKLRKAAELMREGVPAITNATGKKWVLKGKVLPGTGVFVEKVEKLSGKKVEIVGKPSDFSVAYVKNKYNLNPSETIFFGDSLNSDRLFAKKLGWRFAFVLTGEYTMEDLAALPENDRPEFVIDSVKEINQ